MGPGRLVALVFVLLAVSFAGCGGGDPSPFPVGDPVAPGAPTGLTVVPDAGAVGLVWAPPADDGGSAVVSYRVFRRKASETPTFVTTVEGAAAFADEAVVPGVAYLYTVTAVNAVGEGPSSGEETGVALPCRVVTQPVAAGTFTMGSLASSMYLPMHAVSLSAHAVGRFEVTNREYAGMLNWALSKGYLKTVEGEPYSGGNPYVAGKMLLAITVDECQVCFDGQAFDVETREGTDGTVLQLDHPVVQVPWYGAVVFCNFLSEHEGLSPRYDLSTWGLTTSGASGYRLPTEAEWERDARCDLSVVESPVYWAYGNGANTLDETRGNAGVLTVRPPVFGFTTVPYTTPVGYYDGSSPLRVDGPSPVGCYDMAGNVFEWCHDWYAVYTEDAQTDPTGPGTGTERVARGGSWMSSIGSCYAAHRVKAAPDARYGDLGFRVVLAGGAGS